MRRRPTTAARYLFPSITAPPQNRYSKPKDLLIYYGYPNSFNSGVHAWYNEGVAQEMAQYGLIVLGNGVANPTHPDYANTSIIIPRIKALNPNTLIFCYVSVNQTLVNFQTGVDQSDTLGVHGIFMDEAGYDYGKTRVEFNDRVDYVHGKSNSSLCFANAWNTDNILGVADDASFPNSTYNTGAIESNLTTNDWILAESFPINTTAFTASTPNGYETKSDWYVRGEKIKNLRYTYGVNFAGCGIINDGNSEEQNLFNFGFVSAMMYNLEAFGTSDTSYGSGSAKTKFISRPDVSKMGVVWNIYPSVTVNTLDADVYHRYVENAKLSLDFSDSAQISRINMRGFLNIYTIQGSAGNQATTTDGQTLYWGNIQLAPSTTADNTRVFIPQNGVIKKAYIFVQSGTAGTAESWGMYIRKNNTTDYLIQNLSLGAAVRNWSNGALNIPVSQGDYIEIKEVQPSWTTNPANVRRNFMIYIESIF